VKFHLKQKLVLILAAGLLTATASGSACAYTLKTLYTFCQQANCADGSIPGSGVIMDSNGHLFGTTTFGGPGAHGTIFELIPNAKKTKWNEKTIYTFCQRAQDCPDGAVPNGGLIVDTAGALYGVTYQGGPANEGVAYKLSPNASGRNWKLKVLHRFCTKLNCVDGVEPNHKLTYAGAAGGAPYDGVSPLYGIAGGLGPINSSGLVFQLTPQSGKWDYKIVHAFCGGVCTDDGASPETDLIVDGAGDIYGVTDSGGAGGGGVAFELIPNARKTKWTETILHAFDAETSLTNGYTPAGGLVMDASGNLWGTTVYGGINSNYCALQSCGVVFELASGQAGFTESGVHGFCQEANCTDGAQTAAGHGSNTKFGPLVTDGSGNFFGATSVGGANGKGTLYAWNGSTYTVLYDFCQLSECTDGIDPSAVIRDSAGNLYGTTSDGGNGPSGNDGTVFELTP